MALRGPTYLDGLLAEIHERHKEPTTSAEMMTPISIPELPPALTDSCVWMFGSDETKPGSIPVATSSALKLERVPSVLVRADWTASMAW